MSTRKLTTSLLKRIIREEAAKFGEPTSSEDVAEETEETDADEFADSLAKHIDFVKALKIEERKTLKKLARIKEARSRAISKVKKVVEGKVRLCQA